MAVLLNLPHCFLCLWLFFPVSHCPQAPQSNSYLRRGCVCWIAESPFAGGCPYLLRSTTFRQLVAKGGTLGRSTVACCVFTAMIRVAAMLANFLKASRPALLCAWGQKPQLLDAWRLQDERLLRPHRGNAGTEMGLSAISESRGGPIMTVVFHDPEILSRPNDTAASLTVGLRGKILWGQWLSYRFLRRWDQYSPLARVANHHPNVWLLQNMLKLLLVMWKRLQIEADVCRGLWCFINVLNSAVFKIILHVRAVILDCKSN